MSLKKVLLKQKEIEIILEGLNKLSHSSYEDKSLDLDGWDDLVNLQKMLHDIRKLPEHQTLGDIIEEQNEYWKALWKMRQDYTEKE
jgi:hypothetical protein